MSSVFLSYDRENVTRVRSIASVLERAGHSVWWDRHIHGGTQYSREIEQALNRADAVVVLWSEQSVDSAWVRDEAAAGRDRGRLVPVRLDEVELPLGFRQFQTIDLNRGSGSRVGMRELLRSVGALAKACPAAAHSAAGFAMAQPTGQTESMKSTGFADKFRLVLRALNLSRGAIASAVGVDKSLVGRWAAGTVNPSEHNLARLSQFIGERKPGFSMADWDRSSADLATLFGVTVAAESHNGTLPGFPPAFVEQAHKLTAIRGSSYEGFWRTYRPSVMMPGTIFRDHGMIRTNADGYLCVRMGGAGMTFEGIILPGDSNLFAVFTNSIGAAPYFLIAKGIQLPRADLLEGLLLLSALDAAHTPAAVPIVLERIGDLSGDGDRDDQRCDELIQTAPIAKDGEVSDEILSRLARDVGPAAAAEGGERFLMTATGALSRGSTNSGDLRG